MSGNDQYLQNDDAYRIPSDVFTKRETFISQRDKGKRVKRMQGKVEYEVVGGMVDDSMEERSYGYTRNFIILKRLSEGSKGRPVGSKTTVPEDEYRFHFHEVEDFEEGGGVTTETEMVLDALCQEPVLTVIALKTGLPVGEIRSTVAEIVEDLSR
jgi:hypothetical protein